jgi:hypothetical protein
MARFVELVKPGRGVARNCPADPREQLARGGALLAAQAMRLAFLFFRILPHWGPEPGSPRGPTFRSRSKNRAVGSGGTGDGDEALLTTPRIAPTLIEAGVRTRAERGSQKREEEVIFAEPSCSGGVYSSGSSARICNLSLPGRACGSRASPTDVEVSSALEPPSPLG